jgi:hypothetical protein
MTSSRNPRGTLQRPYAAAPKRCETYCQRRFTAPASHPRDPTAPPIPSPANPVALRLARLACFFQCNVPVRLNPTTWTFLLLVVMPALPWSGCDDTEEDDDNGCTPPPASDQGCTSPPASDPSSPPSTPPTSPIQWTVPSEAGACPGLPGAVYCTVTLCGGLSLSACFDPFTCALSADWCDIDSGPPQARVDAALASEAGEASAPEAGAAPDADPAEAGNATDAALPAAQDGSMNGR